MMKIAIADSTLEMPTRTGKILVVMTNHETWHKIYAALRNAKTLALQVNGQTVALPVAGLKKALPAVGTDRFNCN